MKVAVPVLAQLLRADVRHLALGLDVVCGNSLLLHKLLDEEVPQSHNLTRKL